MEEEGGGRVGKSARVRAGVCHLVSHFAAAAVLEHRLQHSTLVTRRRESGKSLLKRLSRT